jgi:hypothetical protein
MPKATGGGFRDAIFGGNGMKPEFQGGWEAGFHTRPTRTSDPADALPLDPDARGMLMSAMSSIDSLSPQDRAWIVRDEQRWRRAHEIVRANPGLDVAGVYRVLRNLEKTPSERLRSALHHGRLFRVHQR